MDSPYATTKGLAAVEVRGMVPLGVVGRLRSRAHRLFTRSNWNLLVELVRAAHKVSEYNSVLGILWSLISPIGMLLILHLIFSSRYGAAVKAYPLYLLVGIVLVNFFVTSTRYMITVILNNVDLLLNSPVPRETVVVSKLALHIFKLLVELLLCIGLSAYYGLFSCSSILPVIPLLIGYLALVLSFGMVLALAHCFARDVEHIWALASPLWLFVTPVFYGLDAVSHQASDLIYWLNPMTPFLLAFRNALMGDGISGPFWHSLILGIVALAIGYAIFLMLESTALERA